MGLVKKKLIEKIKMIKGFEDADISNLHSQTSRRIIDIPRWFYGDTCCYHTMTECLKRGATLSYSRDSKEFFIIELNKI